VRAPVLQVLLAAVLFGTTGTAQALGPDGTTPLGRRRRPAGRRRARAAARPAAARRPHRRRVRLWRTPVGLLAGLCTALYQVCFFAGVERAGVALGTLVTIGSGPSSPGCSRGAAARAARPRWLAATALCVAGLALLSGHRRRADAARAAARAASGLAYAAYTVAAKHLITAGSGSARSWPSPSAGRACCCCPCSRLQPLGWLARPAASRWPATSAW
jgi:DME family drug/metabolite transporter